MTRSHIFDCGITTKVFAQSEDGDTTELEIGEHGVLTIPQGIIPSGFRLVLTYPYGMRIVIAQKNVGEEDGEYHRLILSQSQLFDSEAGTTVWAMREPIEVKRESKNVWTSWHQQKPNRVDCFLLDEQGGLLLFQIGVITHDSGQTFRLLGEPRWDGRLFTSPQGLVARPSHPTWGPFGDTRRGIFEDGDFKTLLQDTRLAEWRGRIEDIDPPLSPIPNGRARVQWYIPFAGQTGQGIVILHDGSSAWIHGLDIEEPCEADEIKRVYRNELVAFRGRINNWGSKKGPPKLLRVRRVRY
ncbi:MAG: hypothetical protein Q7R48_02245 [bacterium]|nr:hypothetical protein [bacterium]